MLRGQGSGQDSISENLFEKVLDLWQVVDVSLLSVENAYEVLPNGGDPSAVSSIFSAGIKLPNAIANACGEYAGELAVYIGLVSLSDSVEMALKEDPEIFENLGMSTDEVKAGVATIQQQAAGLGGLSIVDRVQCAAIYQAASLEDPSLEPYATIWMTDMVSAIEAGDLNPGEIREQSEFWRVLANDGPNAVSAAEGYEAQATKCDGWVNAVINAPAEGVESK